MRPWHSLLLMIAVLLPFSGLAAQEAGKPASIVLEVEDQSGAVVPKARVLILPLPKGISGTLRTNNDGRVSLAVPAGNYMLRVQMDGFRPAEKHIEAESGGHQTLSVLLRVDFCPQCLEVVACPAPGCPPWPSFPQQSQVASADGRYVLVRKGWPWTWRHTVELEDHVLGTRRKLCHYDQRVVFFWSGKMLIATDYTGNQGSYSTLYSVDRRTKPIQVLDLLLNQLDEDERKGLLEVLRNRRVSVEALGYGFNGMAPWGRGLGVRVSAQDPKGTAFEWTFGVRVPAG